MSRDDIIKLAREAGCDEIHVAKVLMGLHFKPDGLERFAQMVAAAEREACAKLADEIDPVWESISDAIRARGQQ